MLVNDANTQESNQARSEGEVFVPKQLVSIDVTQAHIQFIMIT